MRIQILRAASSELSKALFPFGNIKAHRLMYEESGGAFHDSVINHMADAAQQRDTDKQKCAFRLLIHLRSPIIQIAAQQQESCHLFTVYVPPTVVSFAYQLTPKKYTLQ